MKRFCKFVLKLLHYNIIEQVPPETKKCIILFAPHTSWRDFVIGKMALIVMGVKTIFLIKKEVFFFPLNHLLRSVGGYPVDRKNPKAFAYEVSKMIHQKKEVALLIAPEGTRKRVEKWKRGFYTIALEAKVPIALGYLDYNSRRGGIDSMFYPTGDYQQDLQKIEKFYYGMKGRYEGKFNLEDKPYAHPDWLNK